VGWVGSVTTENSAVRPYPHPLDSFGFPSAQAEGTDTGHREKVEIHRPNCLTVAVTQRARQGPLVQLFAKMEPGSYTLEVLSVPQRKSG
jgi:hypothetical protein